MGNIVFLDVDGVLNSLSTKERIRGYTGIDDSKVEVLKHLVEENQAGIVLSSTWKRDWARWEERPSPVQTEFGDYLDTKLAVQGLRILDKTVDEGWNRGQGIIRWLLDHGCPHYVVLDDEMFRDFKACGVTGHLVRTSVRTGLKPAHIREAGKMFAREVKIPAGWEDAVPQVQRWIHFGR